MYHLGNGGNQKRVLHSDLTNAVIIVLWIDSYIFFVSNFQDDELGAFIFALMANMT